MGRVFFRLPDEITDYDLREQINIFLNAEECEGWGKVKRRAITLDPSEFGVVEDIAYCNDTSLNCAMDFLAIHMLRKQVKALKEGISTFQMEELKKKTDYYERMLNMYRRSMLKFERQQEKFFNLMTNNKEKFYSADDDD